MTRALWLAAALSLPAAAAAQTPSSSTRAMGMGNGYTASARGYEAIAWNPGLLGIPGRAPFSFNLGQVNLRYSSNALGLREFGKYSEEFLTRADKDTIMDLIRDGDPDRPLTLGFDVGLTSLAVQAGPFAGSIAVAGAADGALSSDIVELLLYGNVTRRAPGETYQGTGTAVGGWGAGTVALSYGLRLPVPVGTLAVGATAKFSTGVIVGRVEDLPGSAGTSLQTNPNFDARVGIHGLVSDLEQGNYNGMAWGLDLGGAYQLASGLRFGVMIENLFHPTAWNDERLVYYRKQFRVLQNGDTFQDTTIADLDRVPYDATDPVQKALRDSMVRGTFPTKVRAGVNYEAGPLTIAGGITLRPSAAIEAAEAQSISAGAELRIIPFLPLRAGFTNDFGSGTTVSLGTGLKLGPVRIDGAFSSTPRGDYRGFQGAFGIGIIL